MLTRLKKHYGLSINKAYNMPRNGNKSSSVECIQNFFCRFKICYSLQTNLLTFFSRLLRIISKLLAPVYVSEYNLFICFGFVSASKTDL